MSGLTSTGRGGTGNIAEAAKSPRIEPSDLQTPTLKTPIVTTGRGGLGNMAPNIDPAETRARQDVGPVERRPSPGVTHVGRGGAANISKPKSPEPKVADETGTTQQQQSTKTASDKEKERSLAAKAKGFFKRT